MKWFKFFRLSPGDKWLFIRVASLLLLTRLLLFVLPYRTVLRFFERVKTSGIAGANRLDEESRYVERVVFLARAAGRRLLGSRPCLPQALVVEGLLRRRGIDANLHIGVIKQPDHKLLAHAWVESGGDVVIGGRLHSRRYARLRPLRSCSQ